MTAQLWKTSGQTEARLTFRCPWCDVVGTAPVLASHRARDAYWLFAGCPEPSCERGVMVRLPRVSRWGAWLGVDTGDDGLLLDRRCVFPTAAGERERTRRRNSDTG